MDRTSSYVIVLRFCGSLTFGNIRRMIKKIEEAIMALQSSPQSIDIVKEPREKQIERERLLRQEETYWFQRFWALWLKD